MTCQVNLAGTRRSDWDWSGRTRPVVEVLVGQLAGTGDPAERADIVRRLTEYVQSFPVDQVDFGHLNAALAQHGFPPVAGPAQGGSKRPVSEMPVETRAAFDRAERFHGHELDEAMRRALPTRRPVLAQVSMLVRANCGDQLSAEDYQHAMRVLQMASQG